MGIFLTETPPIASLKHLFRPLFLRNPLFPALRSSPTAVQEPPAKSKFLAVKFLVVKTFPFFSIPFGAAGLVALMILLLAGEKTVTSAQGVSHPVLTIESPLPIHISAGEPKPLLRAVEDLQRDLRDVLGMEFPIVHNEADLAGRPAIRVIGPAAETEIGRRRWVDGREAHRVFVEQVGESHSIVLQGADMRGAIYAVYSFSEHILGIPPLWVWASTEVEKREKIEIPLSTDLAFGPPHVEWRTWFPNDQDYLIQWKMPGNNRELIAETMLRLKINAWDPGSILNDSLTGLSGDARAATDRGLAVMSTHTSPLGTAITEARWNTYWNDIRKQAPPKLAIANTAALMEFWRHSVSTVLAHGVETIWTVTFRGHRDVPFWETYPDAPTSDPDRAAIIESMLAGQVALVEELAGDDPIMRVTLYNEMSDLFLAGLLKLPEGENIIWNLVAARRDHFPPPGIFEMKLLPRQPIGLYFNMQFTSTGSHVAQGEGPWKMEANFRIVDGLTTEPLALAMVNAGNIREFAMELSANARLMWDFETFDSDVFLNEFAAQYFGPTHATEIAQLYRDFFQSYWEQRPPDIEGFERQFFFHDLRYSRAIRDILTHLENNRHTREPFSNADFYRIHPEHTNATNTLDAIIAGTGQSIGKLRKTSSRADALMGAIPPNRRLFFNDNLRVQAHFMLRINESLHALARALDRIAHPDERAQHLDDAYTAFLGAREILREAEHGRFETWYPRPGSQDVFRFDEIEARLTELHQQAKTGR